MANFVKHLCAKKILDFSKLKSILSTSVRDRRTFSSSIFVPGNKANKSFAYLSPDLYDFGDHFADLEKLQKELDQRNLKVDVKTLCQTWEYYKYLTSDKHNLEEKLAKIQKELSSLFRSENISPEEERKKQNFLLQNKLIKQDIKAVKEAAWEVEESMVPQILKLPNEVDERTPTDSPLVLKSIGERPNVAVEKSQNHLDIGKNLGLLDYKNPLHCYLHDKAAFFELEALALAGKVLSENSFVRVSGADSCRSIIVEGSGMDHKSPTESFLMQHIDDVKEEYLLNRLHLVGGASLPSLLAMYTKQTFKPYDFPLRIFSTGRQYTPFPNTTTAHGLFSVCQASAAQALTFVERKDSPEFKAEFERLIETATKIYDEIGRHYRIVIKPIKELSLAESMRVSFEMWSVNANQYVEVGHVSMYGDYFSKRLMIACPTKAHFSYPAAVTGTLLSVPRVLGCLLEEHPDKFVIPEKLSGFF